MLDQAARLGRAAPLVGRPKPVCGSDAGARSRKAPLIAPPCSCSALPMYLSKDWGEERECQGQLIIPALVIRLPPRRPASEHHLIVRLHKGTIPYRFQSHN